MASSTQNLAFLASKQLRELNLHAIVNIRTLTGITYLRHFSTDIDNIDIKDNVSVEKLDEIKKIQNVSGLKPYLRNRMEHVNKWNKATLKRVKTHRQRDVLREAYAKYGRKSGIDPAVHWPTEEELDEMIEIDEEWEPSLQERWDKVEEEKRAELAKIKWKEDLVDKQMAKMPDLIKKYDDRIKVKQLELKKQEDKKREMLEEARDYFGYYVTQHDPKFKMMMEEKTKREQEERKMKRKQVKAEKQREKFEALVQKSKEQ